jgi:hypothetical protein
MGWDKRTQVVHDLDRTVDACGIDELMASEQFASFGPDLVAEAAEGHCELHVLPKGGHRLRHDPRAIAILLGWLDRQSS